jgi:[protein-PII] uridylyltransferase
LRARKPGEIAIDALFDEETQTLEYRVITHETTAPRSSHRIAGVLAAKGMEIISAQLTTSRTGSIIDSFRVVDEDYDGAVPAVRIDEVKSAVESVLRGERSVRSLFKAHRRFRETDLTETTSALPMRVGVDNDSSDRCTVIEVFAHDRPGLLYTILRTLFDLDLSIEQAKIATHVDQVVDVFYVTDAEGRKIKEKGRLTGIREDLEGKLTEFEERGYVQFV